MLRKDNFLTGLIVGILFPVMFFVIFNEINNMLVSTGYFQGGSGFSERFRAILSVCLNIIPFLIYIRSRKDLSLRGVIAATFVLAFVIVIYYFRQEII